MRLVILDGIMRFRSHDALRAFALVARHSSFSAAAEQMHVTKGAVSHQMRRLENELGFPLFARNPRGITLSTKGQELLNAAQAAFVGIEAKIAELRQTETRALTIGVTTYFASRWLSPRLMDFMRLHPNVRLRVQPMIDLIDWQGEGIDLAVRWGDGAWRDMVIVPLFSCPAWPTGNADAFARVQSLGHEAAFRSFTLLRDRDDSNAWSRWYGVAGIPYQNSADTLIIPDPNVRVQAVVDGQGVALNDSLVNSEIEANRLFRLSDHELSDYGYHLAYSPDAMSNPDVAAFSSWLQSSV